MAVSAKSVTTGLPQGGPARALEKHALLRCRTLRGAENSDGIVNLETSGRGVIAMGALDQ